MRLIENVFKPHVKTGWVKYYVCHWMEALVEFMNETSNLTNNVTFLYSDELPFWIKAVKLMRNICVPVIASVGIIGNILSFIVFSSKGMKKSSCSVFLASLAFVDVLFLLSLTINWLDGETEGIITTDIACQFLIFITYVTGFLSVWFIVGFTLERFIAICLPLKGAVICTVFREKVIVLMMSLSASVLYNFSFWTSGMQQWGTKMKCSHKMEYFRFLQIITWIDTFSTMVIPFILIAVMNYIVLKTVLLCPQNARRQRNNATSRSLLFSSTSCDNSGRENFIKSNFKQKTLFSKSSNRTHPKVRVTKTLMFVSMTFLFLNLPSHVVRLYNLISSVASNNAIISEQFFFLQELTLMLYYITFSCNFFLYTMFGRNFKRSLKLIFQCNHESGVRKKNNKRVTCSLRTCTL